MSEAFIRTEKLLGAEALEHLKNSRVALFGVGGVGGYVAEALARTGVGALDLFDHDIFTESNLNRQILALRSTLGRSKVEIAAQRIREINSDCRVSPHAVFYSAENAADYPLSAYDYIVDAIDSVPSKMQLIKGAAEAGIPILCSMGTGGKMDPSRLKISDISKTSVCPLAKVIRRECRKEGIRRLTVLWSDEEPLAPMPASAVFVPAGAGLMIASRVVRDLINRKE